MFLFDFQITFKLQCLQLLDHFTSSPVFVNTEDWIFWTFQNFILCLHFIFPPKLPSRDQRVSSILKFLDLLSGRVVTELQTSLSSMTILIFMTPKLDVNFRPKCIYYSWWLSKKKIFILKAKWEVGCRNSYHFTQGHTSKTFWSEQRFWSYRFQYKIGIFEKIVS